MLDSLKAFISRLLTRIFGSKAARDLKALLPLVDEINAAYEPLSALSDEELRGKTEEFRQRLRDGETVDDLMVEAFAVVKDACRRHVGRKWSVVGHEITWNMVPFDVQLMGAIVLHRGTITEMATGEGKTLVAVMPLYLNALPDKGCHLVTVNDYLARRDSQWMGEIVRFLGLKVGVISHDMSPEARREAYGCDVTYGTNNEFGFDYLRDNMAVRKEDQVQRGHFYVIVDEVDSVLVDEARTPLIISGPVAATHQKYDELRSPVEKLVKAQNVLIGEMLNEITALLNKAAELTDQKAAADKEYAAGLRLLQVQRGAPKHKRFLKVVADRNLKPLIHRVETDYMRDKQLHLVDEDLLFAIDERDHSINVSDKGRGYLSPEDTDYFMLPDLAEAMGSLDADETLSPKERAERKQEVHLNYARKSDELHTINQLLRAFCLYERDVEYVVQEDKVMIVDEFTGRLMPGRRFSDGLHQALEAKERVRVEGETQTWATITLQNFFRLYEKLAGMTGTAETEAGELWEIYKLDVVVIPTNEVVRRVDYNDLIFRTRREKYNAIIDEIERAHTMGRPVLVGTVTVEVSETLSRMLKRRGVNHSVLNAKFHQSEAEVVSKAGLPGAVTIATNMAGRGTDIKLGQGVVKGPHCLLRSAAGEGECTATESAAACKADMPCGLHIVGTERHDSRRIDRQLRGRSGRQGDPGSSRFFLSLEDDLMRLFGGVERIGSMMDRMGLQEGEVIEHDFVTKAIERAQKRVEGHNFSIRKHLLEYDDVMNQQREVIYGIRNQILSGQDLRREMEGLISDLVEQKLELLHGREKGSRVLLSEAEQQALREAFEELERICIVPFPLMHVAEETQERETAARQEGKTITEQAIEIARSAYEAREAQWGPEITRQVERHVYLRVIDDHWKDHLYEIDLVRGGISLRAYGQKDPLLEYKAEAFGLFETMMRQIAEDTLKMFFRVQLQQRQPAALAPRATDRSQGQEVHASAAGLAAAETAAPARGAFTAPEAAGSGVGRMAGAAGGSRASMPQRPEKQKTVVRTVKKVGRNAPCPCGSGKKYKHCCGKST
ncbi:MAG: preprotein translocase subunit SecA [Candidatus Eisenbacteria sp.]|nr:preprotein translocase subunit SecA [Candidatus Eisenbacteria bacterium]